MDVKVKICGMTNLADVRAAMAAGADLLGFIFFPKSPRHVTPERVRDILAAAGPGQVGVLTVGVFVNESPQTIAQILDFCRLDVAQLHGEEPPAMLGLEDSSAEALAVNPLAPGLRQPLSRPGPGTGRDREPRRADELPADVGEGRSLVYGRAYKALRLNSPEEATALARRYALPPDLRAGGRLPAFLLDAYHPHQRGGTGKIGDWRLASSLASQYPLLLAGGLNPTNVARAVQTVQPWGVDVASGVEESPGQKDHAALRAFVAAARQLGTSRR
jgi:phosphoribosylanthranilate isomerase